MILVEKMIHVARKRLVTIGVGFRITAAAQTMHAAGVDLLVVCGSNHRVVGVVNKTDIIRQIGRCSGSDCIMKVSTVMSRNVIHCQPHHRLTEVWQTMRQRRLRHIPIVDDRMRPLGVVTAEDALQALLREVEQEEQLLYEYVTCVGYR